MTAAPLPLYTYTEAMHDAAIGDGQGPMPTHAETCPLRQREAPKVWRPEWDWTGHPSFEDKAASAVWYDLLEREAPRLYRLYEAHERTCPESHALREQHPRDGLALLDLDLFAVEPHPHVRTSAITAGLSTLNLAGSTSGSRPHIRSASSRPVAGASPIPAPSCHALRRTAT